MSLRPIDGLKQLKGVSFATEVNQVLVVTIDPHVSEAPPCALDLLCRHLVFSFKLHFLLSFEESSPGPLYLNSCNVIHCKAMIFEKSSGETHLVRGLNNSRAEVSQALIFIFMHHIKARC